MSEISVEPYRHLPPAVRKIWVMVPTCRPDNIPAIIENFKRQTFPDKKLIIVENGPAIGACMKHGLEPDLLLNSSPPGAGIARNTALAEIRKRGGGFWATWDDDDWYGSEYLNEIAAFAKRAEIVGKHIHFADLGGRMLVASLERTHSEQTTLSGAALAGWDTCWDFPTNAIGEDTEFCFINWLRGARIYNVSPYHLLVRRYYPGAQHTWPMERREFLRSIVKYGGGFWQPSVDLDIVTGKIPIALGVPVKEDD